MIKAASYLLSCALLLATGGFNLAHAEPLVDDYEDWPLTINGQRSNETKYVSSKLVDLAIDWTSDQENPWFLWLAF